MKSYRVTLVLSERELLKFLVQQGGVNLTVAALSEDRDAELAANEPEAIYKPKCAPRGPRRQRRSKVIDTITGVLAEGPAEAAALKKALTDAGLSPGSLGTGIQILRRDGAVGHDEQGRYYLIESLEQEAAE